MILTCGKTLFDKEFDVNYKLVLEQLGVTIKGPSTLHAST